MKPSVKTDTSLRALKKYNLPDHITPDKLTVKQRKWLLGLLQTGSVRDAALMAYDCNGNKQMAAVIGCENLTKLKLTMNDICNLMGLDVVEHVRGLVDLTQAVETQAVTWQGKVTDIFSRPDNFVRFKAREHLSRIRGMMPERAGGTNISININLGARLERCREAIDVTDTSL